MKQEKPHSHDAATPADARAARPEMEAAALEAIQQLALQVDIDDALHSIGEPRTTACPACDYQNPAENRFCAMCGGTLPEESKPEEVEGVAAASEIPETASEEKAAPLPPGPHNYHHHYHHHYFSYGEGSAPAVSARSGAPPEVAPRDAVRTRPAPGAPMSRAETAARKVAQDWVLACNTKQLDDMVSLYAADATVLRPNVPVLRGTAAIREFFFSLLDAGLGEVELDPLRTEVIGDVAYDAGRCQMLVPVSVSQRREERGKYLMILARQSGEWKIIADCWSIDLGLGVATEPAASKPNAQAPQASAGPRAPRKSA